MGNSGNLGKRQAEASGDICAWIYLFDILAAGDEIFVWEEGGRAAGMVGYTAYGGRRKLGLKRRLFQLLFRASFFYPAIKKREKLREYYDHYAFIPESMKVESACSLDIIIVRKDLRGRGVGAALLDYLCNVAGSRGFERLLIETDDSSNAGFYRRKACAEILRLGGGNERGTAGANETRYLMEKEL